MKYSFIKDLNGLEIVIMYISCIRRAHKVHHKHMGKEQGECFGMLIVPWKYLRQELKKANA
jgi:beta-carotene 3-hydroxylase